MLRRLPTFNPVQRFSAVEREYDAQQVPLQGLEIYEDQSRSILSENDSPDLPFRYSLNAYRGCAHGCTYCYARPSHEYLSWGAGTDFERKLLVKLNAASLLRSRFESKSWQGDLVVVSGNTDAYQPIEAELKLTRACLEVCVEFANPLHFITKSTLIERDLDLLVALNERASVGVSVSVTFWDAEMARLIEPYAPPPRRRVETIRRLTARGIPVMVHVAPVIPGLSDSDMIPILEASREAGAISAMMMPVRLPGATATVFTEHLKQHLPLKAEKVLARIREMRGGALNDPNFFSRQQGGGAYADALQQTFTATTRRLGYGPFPAVRSQNFRRPEKASSAGSAQLDLFKR